MAKPELGTKRVCVSCGARFYDLTKQPAVCPKCSTEQPAEQPRMRRSAGPVEDRRRPKVAPVPGLEDADVEVEVVRRGRSSVVTSLDVDGRDGFAVLAEESDEDVLEDTSDLEDGADAIVEVEAEPNEEER